MEEIKRYRCIKECGFDLCDGDGFIIDGKYSYVEPGSIWQESKNLIAAARIAYTSTERTESRIPASGANH